MNRDFSVIWAALPEDLRARLLADPGMTITDQADFLALTKAGVLVVGTHWTSTSPAPTEWMTDPDFRSHVQKLSTPTTID